MKKLLSILLFAFGFQLSSFAQQTNLDSLNQIWLDETQPDTIRLEAMDEIVWEGYFYSNPDTAFELAKQMKNLAVKKNNLKWEVMTLRLQGLTYYMRSDYSNAILFLEESLQKAKEAGYKRGMAEALSNLGIMFKQQGQIAKALEYYMQSQKIYKEIGEKKGLANNYGNIGIIYQHKGDLEKALEFFELQKNVHQELDDELLVAYSLNTIGAIYYHKGELLKATENYNNSLKIYEENQEKLYAADVLLNIGTAYEDQGNKSLPLDCYKRALSYYEDLKFKEGIAISYSKLSSFYNEEKNYKAAEELGLKSLNLSLEISSPKRIEYAAENLKKIYKNQEKGMLALEMFELEIEMRDSLNNIEAKKGLLKLEVEHQFEKDQLVKEQEAKEATRIEAEKVARRNSIQYSGIGLGIFGLFGLVFLFGRIQLPKWAVELSVFLPFLIFFEFLLVITDPYVDDWSEGVPLIKLGINVVMAAAIFPLHSFFERFLKSRLFKS